MTDPIQYSSPPTSPTPPHGCFTCLACRLVGKFDSEFTAVRRKIFFSEETPESVKIFLPSVCQLKMSHSVQLLISNTGDGPSNNGKIIEIKAQSKQLLEHILQHIESAENDRGVFSSGTLDRRLKEVTTEGSCDPDAPCSIQQVLRSSPEESSEETEVCMSGLQILSSWIERLFNSHITAQFG